MPFDRDWKFHLSDARGAQDPEFADSGWRHLDLPHDWSFEDRPGAAREAKKNWAPPVALPNANERPKDAATLTPQIPIVAPIVPPPSADGPPMQVGQFDPASSAAGWATGWTVGGTGWYRKHFRPPVLAGDEHLEITFDGAYLITEVWLNGASLGRSSHGYLPFSFDMTPHLRQDGLNVLAVRVANEGETARWYSGSGLYRHVWLRRTGVVYIPDYGVVVRTTVANPQSATFAVSVEVACRAILPRPIACRIDIVDSRGRAVTSSLKGISVSSAKAERIDAEMKLSAPALWSPETPNLYQAKVTLLENDSVSGQQRQSFGIRTLHLSPDTGFRINDRSYKLRGTCLHHDNGLLGAMAIDRAERRKVEILKANGFNAIRCSHNPYSPAFYAACDELGMILIDELYDQWEQGKFSDSNAEDAFQTHWQHDVTQWVRRDRNHPSIALWSIGNEIPEVSSPRGIEIGTQLRALILELDPTRFITNALTPSGMGKAGRAARDLLDVSGYNYAVDKIEQDHADNTDQLFVTTESFADSAYEIWQLADKSPWYLGEFLWTAMDYVGETGVGSSRLLKEGAKPDPTKNFMGVDLSNLFVWDHPAYQCGCGDIDILGLKKPASYIAMWSGGEAGSRCLYSVLFLRE